MTFGHNTRRKAALRKKLAKIIEDTKYVTKIKLPKKSFYHRVFLGAFS